MRTAAVAALAGALVGAWATWRGVEWALEQYVGCEPGTRWLP